MPPTLRGPAYVLGDSVDTDQIIPAQFLVYSLTDPAERREYGRFALSAVPAAAAGLPSGHTPFVAEGETTSAYRIVIAGENFGCGSSREHAPFALREAGVVAVVALSYARIFYRNAVDGGFVIPFESLTPLHAVICTGDDVEIDTRAGTLHDHTTGETHLLRPLGDVADIVDAGGIFGYARQQGMIG